MAQIDLGWSLRCHDEAQLAARIEAYVDTKEAIVAFKWCLDNREKRSPPLPDFPPEIRFMIDASLRDMAYQATRPWWLFARKCMLTSCCFEEHFTKDELANYEHDPFENKNDGFPREYRIRHLSVVDNYLASFKLPTSCDNHQEPWVRKFLNCRKVFAEDFNIQPNFIIRESDRVRPSPWRGDHAEIHAYLTKQISSAPLIECEVRTIDSLVVDHAIDPNVLASELALDPKDIFSEAKRVLRLDAPHIFIEVERWSTWPDYGTTHGKYKTDEGIAPAHSDHLQKPTVKEPVEMRSVCIDCDKWPCNAPGGTKIADPEFRMLGSVELLQGRWNDDDS